jgi:hypothetical protein
MENFNAPYFIDDMQKWLLNARRFCVILSAQKKRIRENRTVAQFKFSQTQDCDKPQ